MTLNSIKSAKVRPLSNTFTNTMMKAQLRLDMQTDYREDQVSVRFQQSQNQGSKRQNEKKNGMANGAKTQFNPLHFSKEPNVPEYSPVQEAVCNQSTMRLGTVAKQKKPGKDVNVSSLSVASSVTSTPLMPTTILPEMSTLTRIPTANASHASTGVLVVLLAWFYRCALIFATGILIFFLIQLQSVLDRVPAQASISRTGVQWAELVWLTPVPLALILWLGWFIFAEAVRPDPKPISVPFITTKEWYLPHPTTKPVRLVFRFVTRGDNVD